METQIDLLGSLVTLRTYSISRFFFVDKLNFEEIFAVFL